MSETSIGMITGGLMVIIGAILGSWLYIVLHQRGKKKYDSKTTP